MGSNRPTAKTNRDRISETVLFAFGYGIIAMYLCFQGGCMTYPEIVTALRNAGVDEPEHEARLLIERYSHRTMADVLSARNQDYTEGTLLEAVRERCTRRPLQYIIGEWPFWNETYRVHEGCLIPRPDTEILVETAIARLPRHTVFWDLCSGSGCVGISVLASRKDLKCFAADIEPIAVKLTKENAALNGVEDRICVQRLDLFAEDAWNIPEEYLRPVCILSNPPYIPAGQIDGLAEEVRREPRLALDGGEDGLRFYRRLIEIGTGAIPPEGLMMWEIGAGQHPAIADLARESGYCVEFIKDLAGIERVAVLSRNG